jgi:hypothetical protein
MNNTYENDTYAWAIEQAAYIRSGRFDLLDLENIAEEIEDVGKSEQRELTSRLAVLLAHLLKCQYQPELSGSSWQRTIKEQRKAVARLLKKMPSLKPKLTNIEFLEGLWSDAVVITIKETGRDDFPEACPWSMDDVLNADWLPENVK